MICQELIPDSNDCNDKMGDPNHHSRIQKADQSLLVEKMVHNGIKSLVESVNVEEYSCIPCLSES